MSTQTEEHFYLKGIVHPKSIHPQAIQNVDKFVSSSGHLENVALYYWCCERRVQTADTTSSYQ